MIIISEIKYQKVSIPVDLIESIKEFRKLNSHLGYTSDVDVIKDSIRDKIFTRGNQIEQYQVNSQLE